MPSINICNDAKPNIPIINGARPNENLLQKIIFKKMANTELRTHFTLDILKDGASEYEHPDSSLFTHQMLVKNGVASRKRIIGDKMTMLYSHFQQN